MTQRWESRLALSETERHELEIRGWEPFASAKIGVAECIWYRHQIETEPPDPPCEERSSIGTVGQVTLGTIGQDETFKHSQQFGRPTYLAVHELNVVRPVAGQIGEGLHLMAFKYDHEKRRDLLDALADFMNHYPKNQTIPRADRKPGDRWIANLDTGSIHGPAPLHVRLLCHPDRTQFDVPHRELLAYIVNVLNSKEL